MNSVLKLLEGYGINMHNEYVAARSISILDLSPEQCRAIVGEMLSGGDTSMIGDAEMQKTFQYLVNQYFDATYPVFDLSVAHERAITLIKRFPHILVKAQTRFDEETGEFITIEKKTNNGSPRKGYKKEMALSLYRENKETITERKDWVKLFMKKITGMSKGVAHAYLHNIENKKWAV